MLEVHSYHSDDATSVRKRPVIPLYARLMHSSFLSEVLDSVEIAYF